MGSLGEGRYCAVKHDRYRFAGRLPSKGVVDGVTPELHAEAPDSRVGDCLWQPGQFQIESPQCIVGVAGGLRNKLSNQVCVVVSFPRRQRLDTFSARSQASYVIIPELIEAVGPGLVNVGLCNYPTPESLGAQRWLLEAMP